MITRTSLGLAIAAALPLTAQAHEAAEHAAVPAAVATSSNAIVAVRDAETGRLRAATAEEYAALAAQTANKKALRVVPLSSGTLTPQLKVHSSGAVGVRMTDDTMSQSVVVLRADGTRVQRCFSSKKEVDAFMKSDGAKVDSVLPTE